MPQPGVHIETIRPPQDYHPGQLDKACVIAAQLNRGRLVLCEPPRRRD